MHDLDELNLEDPLVSIIILNYNGIKYIIDCLESVYTTKNCKFEVLLIDNNSTDESPQICKNKFPEIRLFQNKENLAMAARNVGIDNAKGDFILFLDADTVIHSDTISILIESYRQHGDGLYQGKELAKRDPAKLESGGNMTNVFGFGFARGRGKSNDGNYDHFETISFPVGGFTFSSSNIIKKIGYVDESNLFFLMLDDVDYGWRSWMLGIPCYYEPKSTILHLGSPVLQFSKKKFFYAERNRLICLFSLYSTKTLLKIFPLLLLIEFGSFLFLISKGLGITKIKSFLSFMKILSKIIKRRKKIQKTRKLSDKKIIQNFVDYIELPLMVSGSTPKMNTVLIFLSKIARHLI